MTESSVSLAHLLGFYLCKGLGVKTLLALTQKYPLDKLFSLSQPQLIASGLNHNVATALLNTDWEKVKYYQNLIEQSDIQVIDYYHPQYPHNLKEIASAPLLLFCRGDCSLLSSAQIAIVGSRNATPTGLEVAAEFAHQLCIAGLTITSGMARGIDGSAHKGALSAQGKTIAVLGTGVDVYYPKRHRLLTDQVLAQGGLLVSEFLPKTVANANNFPRRNRLIAGLSLGVMIVEAEIKSGSLITVRYAIEQNKEVFAVPGSIKNPLSQASHFLIKQGAKLVENVSDILEEVSFSPKSSLYNIEIPTKEQQPCPVLDSIGYEITSVDEVVSRSQWPVEQVLARLLDLELADQIERVLDGYIRLGALKDV